MSDSNGDRRQQEADNARLVVTAKNMQAILDTLGGTRQQVDDLAAKVVSWEGIIANYVRVVTDLQRQVGQLRDEIAVNKYAGGGPTA